MPFPSRGPEGGWHRRRPLADVHLCRKRMPIRLNPHQIQENMASLRTLIRDHQSVET